MNITNDQMKAIRRLLSKEDRQAIGMQISKSARTVDAVLQCDRTNHEIEEAIIIKAKQNIAYLQNVITDIEAKNTIKATLIEYRKIKQSSAWVNDFNYNRYIDVYLQLTHINFVDSEELWLYIWKHCKDIITMPYYCIDLFTRLLGLDENSSVKFFNKKYKEQ